MIPARIAAVLPLIPCLSALTPPEALTLGQALLRSERAPAALELVAPVLKTSPDNAELHELMGEILFRDGQIVEAEKEFKTAIQLQPKIARSWLGLGRVYWCASHRKTAQVYFKKAHDLDPSDPEIVFGWAQTLRGEEHIAALESYLKLGGDDADHDARDALKRHIDLDRQFLGKKMSQLVSPYEPTDIPLHILYDGPNRIRGAGLTVSVNGNKPIRLLLDTGASGIVIRPEAADRAGLESVHEFKIGGIGDAGLRSAYSAIAKSVRIQGFEMKDVPVTVAERKALGEEDGLIGTDVFEKFLVKLEFVRLKMHLEPLPKIPGEDEEALHDRVISPEMKGFQPVFRFGHLLTVPTRLNGSRQYLFGLDTGAQMTTISNDIAAAVTKIRGDEYVKVHGVSGKVNNVFSADQIVLQFAGYKQANLDMVAFQQSTSDKHPDTEIAGLLGLPVLCLFTLTIDYRDGLVNFEFKLR